jgi:hypothetical protein
MSIISTLIIKTLEIYLIIYIFYIITKNIVITYFSTINCEGDLNSDIAVSLSSLTPYPL